MHKNETELKRMTKAEIINYAIEREGELIDKAIDTNIVTEALLDERDEYKGLLSKLFQECMLHMVAVEMGEMLHDMALPNELNTRCKKEITSLLVTVSKALETHEDTLAECDDF